MDTMIGPKLTDAKFFGELIDCTLPGLEGVPAAAAAGDYAACRKMFGDYVRAALDPDTFFTIPYEFPENAFTFKGETEEEAAERIAKLYLISCGTPHQFEGKVDWFANPTYNKYKEWTWQLSRCHEWKLLAHQYHLTGNEKHAEVFAQLFDSWVKQAVVPEDDVNGGATLCWRTIECGIRMGADWPYTLFSFYKSPHFTDDLLTDWYKSVWEHGHRLQLNHRTGNWLIMEMNGLAQIGILYPVLKNAKEWFAFAINQLTEELDRQVYPEDHFQFELATGYHYVVINNYMRLVRVARAYGVALPEEFTARIEKMLETYVKIMQPDGRMPDINDGSNAFIKTYIGEQEMFFPENKTFDWVCSDRATDEGKPEYTSLGMEYAGMMVMRTGWGKDDVWAFMDAAPFGTGHQHEDKLNLLMYAHGKYILTECGSYSYDDSEMRKYALSTRSHNTVRVNGMDQNRRVCYHWNEEDIQKKSNLVHREEAWFDYARSEYDEGYGTCNEDTAFKDKDINDIAKGPAYMGAKHKRSVLFLKNPGHDMEPYFVVIDRMYSEDRNEYEILWHVDAEEVTLKGMQVKADFLHIMNNLKDVHEDGVNIVCSQQTPEWQGWQRGPSHLQRDDIPLPTVRYTTHAESTRVVTVLYPGEDCPIACVDATTNVDSTRFTLVMKNGDRVQFDEANFAPDGMESV